MKKSIICLSILAMLPAPVVLAQGSGSPLEIVITGGLVPVTRDHVGTSVTVITAEQIEQRNYDFVADILKDVAGVTLSQSGGPGTLNEVRIRGAEADQTLVLIDGIEANDPAASSRFDFAHLLAQDVERIEVLRGAQSALWGSDAIGGVVNIITKSGRGLEQPAYSYAAEYGTYSTLNGAVGTRGDTGLVDYALSLQHYQSDGFSSADENVVSYTLPDGSELVTGGNTEDDSYKNTTAHLKFGVDASQDLRIEGVIRNTDFDSDFDGFTTIPVDSTDDRSEGDQQYYLLQGRYSQMGGAMNHTLKYFGNRSDTDFYSAFGKTDTRGGKDHYGYQLDYNWRSGMIDNGVSMVIETETDKLDSTFSGNRDVSNDSLVGEYRFANNGIAASANVRYDDNDLFENKTSWRLAGSWQFAPEFRLHTSYGTGIKNPTLIELYGFTPDFVGNENLKPEESHGGDIGIEFASPDGRHLTDITLFHRKIDELITGSGNTAVNVDGESTSEGLELSHTMRVNEQFDLYGAYTYNKTEDAAGEQLIRRPKHNLSVGGDYGFMENRLRLGASLRYVADRKDSVFNPDFTTSNVDMDDYTVVDASARYRVNEFISIKARIDNLFDEQYQELIGYGTSGRAYYVGISGEF